MTRGPRPRSVVSLPLAAALALLAAAPAAAQRGIWVANANGDSVTGYESTLGGNQSPVPEITGTPGPLELASSVAGDAGRRELFVSLRSFDSVAVFDFSQNGLSTPVRTLSGAATTIDTPWDIEVDHERGELYVLSKDASRILVFPITATGGAPIRTIQTSPLWDPLTFDFDLDLVHDEIVVADRTAGAVGLRFFALGANGTVAPLRSIAGAATGLTAPSTVTVDPLHDEVFVVNSNGTILVFSRTASGSVAPLRMISGAATGINASAGGLDVDPVLGELAVLRSNPDDALLFFSRTASGNTAPLRTIVGAATHLNGPSRISYFPFLVFADGFESGGTSAWSAQMP
jgi:hypothetical protein